MIFHNDIEDTRQERIDPTFCVTCGIETDGTHRCDSCQRDRDAAMAEDAEEARQEQRREDREDRHCLNCGQYAAQEGRLICQVCDAQVRKECPF